MSQGPKVQETSRIDLIQMVHAEIDKAEEQYPELVSLKASIHNAAEEILAKLPNQIVSHKIILLRCKDNADKAVLDLSTDCTEDSNKITEALSKLRKDLCTTITLALYSKYINAVIDQIKQYQESNTPVKWGLISTRDFGKIKTKGKQKQKNYPLLPTFSHFWRNIIEAEGDDFFQKHILTKLDPAWQEKYQMKIACPHEWPKMTNEEIAKTLTALKRPKDAEKLRWSFSGIQSWTGEKGEKWGLSFYSFWSRKYPQNSEEKFKTEILPHLPTEWHKNFVPKHSKGLLSKCPHDWHRLSLTDTKDQLLLLKPKRNPAKSRWSFGAIDNWIGEKGEKWGASFTSTWKNRHKDKAEQEFRKQLLPLFPPELQATYCERGHKILFITSPADIQETLAKTNNLDELVKLAKSGYQEAFDKTLAMAMHYLAGKFPDSAVPQSLVETLIHTHLPVLGKLEAYLTISADKFLLGEKSKHSSLDESSSHDRGLGVKERGPEAEAKLLEGLEPTTDDDHDDDDQDDDHLQSLKDLNISPAAYKLLTARIKAGQTLKQLMATPEKGIAKIAKQVSYALGIA